ncbi:WxL domain-containing protein [Lactiplantibacillus nangangensis]|uniref:WxL domain-containing protein n=1 Tax=Lactiplantibacillus nangangensis TaxID=2559917 RepID=A0ABW1SFG6_9LACO|nr:WxL domain-containing protein [Lactiplantibacillus nangangensis]
MTKSQQLSGLLSFLLLIGTPLTTLAADTSDKPIDPQKSTTGFEIIGSNLQFSSFSDFKFESDKAENIINHEVTLHSIDKEHTLAIQDYRGTHEGWTLSATMSNVTEKDSGRTIKQPTLTLNPTLSTADSQKLAPNKNIRLTPTTTQPVLNVAENSGEGNTQLSFTNTTITIPKQYDISAGTYTADLKWTLAPITKVDTAQ